MHKLCSVRRADADPDAQAVQKPRKAIHSVTPRSTLFNNCQKLRMQQDHHAQASVNQTAESSEFDPVSLGAWAAEASER